MKLIKKLTVLLCIALMLFSMSGCRDSSVLEKIIYDYLRAHQTDMEKDTYDDQEDNELDDNLHDIEKDEESDRENDEEKVDPVYSQQTTPTQLESAGTPDYSNNSNRSETPQAAQGTPSGSSTVSDTVVSADVSEEDVPEEEPPEMEQEPGVIAAEDPPKTDDEEKEQPSTPDDSIITDNEGELGTSGGNTTRLVVDDYGNQYEVPENVDTVAAVDSAAVAVLMLGGVDCLAATNEDLTSDTLSTDVFSGLSSVPSLWEGTGTTAPLSSSALQSLIDIHPDVCLETSGSATFTNDQVETLIENGIYYVVLPAPSSTANLKLIAQVVGEILGDHSSNGGYDSASVAKSYRSWVDRTVSDVADAGGSSAFTLYVDGWDPEAYYKLDSASGCYGYGAAVINNKRMDSCKAISDFLSNASVTNVTSLADFVRTETVYFIPFNTNWASFQVTGQVASRLTPLKLLNLGGNLGTSTFQTVIAGSQAVKTGLESNKLWDFYDVVTSIDGNFNGYGFLDDSGQIVSSSIEGNYNVIVNPRGIGAWASGSVESILETVWASYAIAGGYSESEMRGAVSEFYSTFYHYTLSEKQLDAILAGES